MKKSAGLPTKADSPAPAENKKCTAARATCARWCHKIGTPRMGAIYRAHDKAVASSPTHYSALLSICKYPK
jgi:hypothetical protein